MKNFILGILFVVFGRRIVNGILDFVIKLIESPRTEPVIRDWLAEKITDLLFDGPPPGKAKSFHQRLGEDYRKSKTHQITIHNKKTTRIFGPHNPNWSPQPEHNEMFIKSVQNHLNNILQVKGSLLLNDVYEALGFERTQEGMLLGWIEDEGGFVEISREQSGTEGSLLLRFTPHTLVYNALPYEDQVAAQT